MKANLFDLIFKSFLQVSVSCNNLVDHLWDQKTLMNKGKHTKRDALRRTNTQPKLRINMHWSLSTEAFCVAKTQLQYMYLLKFRQATFAMFYVQACKLKQQEKILKMVLKSKTTSLSRSSYLRLVFTRDRVRVRIIVGVVRELMTWGK